MKGIEYQALVFLKDTVWTKIMGNVSQDWSTGKCKYVTQCICEIVGYKVFHVRTLRRFIDALENGEESPGRVKHILLYFLKNRPLVQGEAIDLSLYQNYLQQFLQENSPSGPYTGEYFIYTRDENENGDELGNVINNASITITDNGTAILNAGKEVFQGRFEKKNINLHFKFENTVESIYMIIRVGLTLEQHYLNALAGIYIAVSNENSSPFGELIVLVKKGTEHQNDTKQRVKTVFDTIGENYKVKVGKKLSRLLDMDIPIEKALEDNYTGKDQSIKYLCGNWIAYTVDAERKELYQSLMVIKGKNTLSYRGARTSYNSGFIDIHGESIFIYMSGSRKAFISTSSMYRDWTTLKELVGTYATVNAETHQPSMGCVILRKASPTTHSDFIPRIYFKGTKEYAQYVDIVGRLHHFILNHGILENIYDVSPRYERKPSPTDELDNQLSYPAINGDENPPLGLIQGGIFEMGDVFGDAENGNETPHYVTLDSFYLARYPVTIEDYDKFCVSTKRPLQPDFGWGRGKQPVVDINWYDTIEYCNWLSLIYDLVPAYQIISNEKVFCNWQATGFRLPTEAEWEYAAREGGKPIRFGNGSPVADPQKLNFDGQSKETRPYAFRGENRNKTAQVGSLNNPNALGLHDMSGNVWEWCWDYYMASISEGQQNPRGPETGHERAIRGGSWNNAAAELRCSCRDCKPPEFRRRNIGFRIARSI